MRPAGRCQQLGADAAERNEQPSEHARRNLSVPDWVPTDDVIADHPDRQVLVVGDTVVGFALTLFLRHAGYDPLVLDGTSRPLSSRITYLCPPALRTLDAIGVGSVIRKRGTAVDSVSVHRSESRSEDATGLSGKTLAEGTPPLVVRRDRLRNALESRLPDQQRGVDRAVEKISPQDGGLAVDFEDGIREWFDVVVDAGGGSASLHPTGGDAPASDTLTQYEVAIEPDSPAGQQLREHWYPDAFGQQFPSPNGSGNVLRVTTPHSDVERGVAAEDWEPFLSNQGGSAVHECTDGELTSVRQVRLSDADVQREWWGADRVSFCGPAACPIAPASGFDVTLGIEDAVAFVSELTATDRSVADVVDAYSSRRAHRLTTLQQTLETAQNDSEYPLLQSTQPALASLGALRVVALGSFLDAPMRSLQRNGFRTR